MGTPKVVTDAMVPDILRLPGGLVLRPLSIAHTLLLQKIGSPFIDIGGGDASADAPRASRAPSELDALAVVYLLTRDEPEIDALFFGFDPAQFQAAVWRFAKEQPPALLVDLDQKLTTVFQRATSTLIGARADGDDSAAAAGAGGGAKKKTPARST